MLYGALIDLDVFTLDWKHSCSCILHVLELILRLLLAGGLGLLARLGVELRRRLLLQVRLHLLLLSGFGLHSALSSLLLSNLGAQLDV